MRLVAVMTAAEPVRHAQLGAVGCESGGIGGGMVGGYILLSEMHGCLIETVAVAVLDWGIVCCFILSFAENRNLKHARAGDVTCDR